MAALPDDEEKKFEDEKDDSKHNESTALMADGDMEKLMAEIEKQPLVSEKRSLESLLAEFKDHANFSRQMNTLIKDNQHSSYRQMRRDGNCFYRAFLLGLFQTIETNRDMQLLTTVSQHVMTSLQRCLKYGFDSFTIEDFYYAFMDELEFYQRKLESMDDEFKAQDGIGNNAIQRMSNSSHAQYLIFWARMLASLHLREHEHEYAAFIPHDKGGFAAWLRSDVEALKSEADHLQTMALSRSIEVPITIYCFENVPKGGPQVVHTIESKKSCYDLLYRPGHYDLLYRGNAADASTTKEENSNTDQDADAEMKTNDDSNTESQNAAADKSTTMQSAATNEETAKTKDVAVSDNKDAPSTQAVTASDNNDNTYTSVAQSALPNNGNTSI